MLINLVEFLAEGNDHQQCNYYEYWWHSPNHYVHYHHIITMKFERQNVRAVPTGEFRCPRKGEWYLSGAIVCAYRAGGNFTSKYHIARLVAVRRVVTETYVPY